MLRRGAWRCRCWMHLVHRHPWSRLCLLRCRGCCRCLCLRLCARRRPRHYQPMPWYLHVCACVTVSACACCRTAAGRGASTVRRCAAAPRAIRRAPVHSGGVTWAGTCHHGAHSTRKKERERERSRERERESVCVCVRVCRNCACFARLPSSFHKWTLATGWLASATYSALPTMGRDMFETVEAGMLRVMGSDCTATPDVGRGGKTMETNEKKKKR